MYSFLIVEDEQYARKHIAAILAELNGGNVYEAENGATALRIIAENKIDSVITDIQMPVMNGIELVRELHKNRSPIVCAVLSGFDEFTYIQTAIKFSVIDYILKPVDPKEIKKLYYKIIRRLRTTEHMNNEIEKLTTQSARIRPFIRQRFFLDLISGKHNQLRIDEMREYLHLNIGSTPARIALIEVDKQESNIPDSNEKEELKLYNILELIEKIALEWKNVDTFTVTTNTIAVIWSSSMDTQDASAFVRSLENLINEMNEIYSVVINVAVSGIARKPSDFHHAYEEADDLLKYKLIYGSGQVFDSIRFCNMGTRKAMLPDTQPIIQAVWRNAPNEAIAMIEQSLNDVTGNAMAYSVSSVKLYLQKIMTDCLILLEQEGIGMDRLNVEMGQNVIGWNSTDRSRSEALLFFRKLIPRICDMLNDDRSNERKQTIESAKEIISIRYAEAISVKDIADELHFSQNYFGSMFKKEMGMSIGEYVNLYRIQRAKKLILENKMKMYEIATSVGFRDQQYFTKVFKKIVGCIPTDFQK